MPAWVPSNEICLKPSLVASILLSAAARPLRVPPAPLVEEMPRPDSTEPLSVMTMSVPVSAAVITRMNSVAAV